MFRSGEDHGQMLPFPRESLLCQPDISRKLLYLSGAPGQRNSAVPQVG